MSVGFALLPPPDAYPLRRRKGKASSRDRVTVLTLAASLTQQRALAVALQSCLLALVSAWPSQIRKMLTSLLPHGWW